LGRDFPLELERNPDRVRIPPFFLFVIRLDRTQVQLIDQIADEIRQVSFGQSIPQTGR
jgi:hypothetical protein